MHDDMPGVLAMYLWSRGVSWCLAEGYCDGDESRPMGNVAWLVYCDQPYFRYENENKNENDSFSFFRQGHRDYCDNNLYDVASFADTSCLKNGEFC